MDKSEPEKGVSEDVARESLIAISNKLPDSDISTDNQPKNSEGEKVDDPLTCDREEKSRSELISISFSLPPDGGNVPVA